VRLHGRHRVLAAKTVRWGPHAIVVPPNCIGDPLAGGAPNDRASRIRPTVIGGRARIGPFVVIGQGSYLGHNVEVYPHCLVGEDTRIGNQTKIVYAAQIHNRVEIGTKCIVGGFVCNGSKIGDRTSCFGQLVHKYRRHSIDEWNDESADDPPAPNIGSDTVVAFGAIIIGGVTIGSKSYIGPREVIDCDLPPGSRVLTQLRRKRVRASN
jgi:UDP-3-O-[3-hydroxymyristoyl] glucosamine N-acyltransferase